jgi:hypothetical protein
MDFKKERFVIEIDPDTGDYMLDADFVSLSRLRNTCADIVNKIDKGELKGPELNYVRGDDLDENAC